MHELTIYLTGVALITIFVIALLCVLDNNNGMKHRVLSGVLLVAVIVAFISFLRLI